MMTDFLSTHEAATMLGMSPQHLRRLIEDGQIAATQIGHRFVVDAASLKTFSDTRKAATALPSVPAGTLTQLMQVRKALLDIPWDRVRQAQQVLLQFQESGLADAIRAAQQAGEVLAPSVGTTGEKSPAVWRDTDDGAGASFSPSPRPAWREWAGSDDPAAAIAKLRERAHARTRGTRLENSTDLLRALREGRH